MTYDKTDPVEDLVTYNRHAWDEQVQQSNKWTVPVSSEQVEKARNDDWTIVLTAHKPVPKAWFPDFRKSKYAVLCLAGAGGQQAPLLAAAGASVTVFDNSPNQLAQDRMVAEREGLAIETIQGDMADLGVFKDESFDLIVHPCSNTFVPDVNPVWQEAARILRPNGNLISGFLNPIYFMFDDDLMAKGEFKVVHKIPYSDLTSITAEKRQAYIDAGEPLCFGHRLSDQIGGQIRAGLQITGFYEDKWDDCPLSKHISLFVATRSTKPAT